MLVNHSEKKDIELIKLKLDHLTTSLRQWKFLYLSEKQLINYHKSLNVNFQLDQKFLDSKHLLIIDKKRTIRGRTLTDSELKKSGDTSKIKYTYNIESAAELHNEMNDDVKILLREYRLALKKNNRIRSKKFTNEK